MFQSNSHHTYETRPLIIICWAVPIMTAVFSAVALISSFLAFDVHPVSTILKALGIVAFFVMGVFGYLRWKGSTKDSLDSLGFLLLSAIIGFALSMLLVGALNDRARLAMDLYDAKVRIKQQGRHLGITPRILADLEMATDNYENALQQREILNEVLTGNFDSKSVVAHIVAARTLGVDATFVQENGFVRKSDEKALFDAALNRADNGDAVAQMWLAQQETLAIQ